MIRCIIVDDEPLARQVIRKHLERFPEWEVLKECINATEAWQAIHETEVQVMFLDIQMPGISGMEFLRSLKKIPVVIFITAYAHYAVEGFELMAADYLLKPVTFDRFKQAITRAQEKIAQPTVTVLEKVVEMQAPAITPDHIFLKLDNKLIRLNFTELLFFEAQRDFTKVYLQDRNILVSFHLKIVEGLLPGRQFIRVHRSYIINTTKITSVEGNRVVIQNNNIPIGSNYKDAFLASLGSNRR